VGGGQFRLDSASSNSQYGDSAVSHHAVFTVTMKVTHRATVRKWHIRAVLWGWTGLGQKIKRPE